MVEQGTHKPLVGGSIPPSGTSRLRSKRRPAPALSRSERRGSGDRKRQRVSSQPFATQTATRASAFAERKARKRRSKEATGVQPAVCAANGDPRQRLRGAKGAEAAIERGNGCPTSRLRSKRRPAPALARSERRGSGDRTNCGAKAEWWSRSDPRRRLRRVGKSRRQGQQSAVATPPLRLGPPSSVLSTPRRPEVFVRIFP